MAGLETLAGRRILVAEDVGRLIGRLGVACREAAEIREDMVRLGLPVTDVAWKAGVTLELGRAGLLDMRPDVSSATLVSLLEAEHRQLRSRPPASPPAAAE